MGRQTADALSLEADQTLGGRQCARNDIHAGGLARPIGADQPHHLTRTHSKADALERRNAAKGLAHIAQHKQGLCAPAHDATLSAAVRATGICTDRYSRSFPMPPTPSIADDRSTAG